MPLNNPLTAGLQNIANRTSFPVQHASQSASVRRSADNIRLALSGYGCTTVKYRGSSSGGGGVLERFGIVTTALRNGSKEYGCQCVVQSDGGRWWWEIGEVRVL